MSTLSSLAPSVRPDFADDFPIPRHLIPAAALLAGLEYTPQATDEALAHLGLFGTAECNPHIDPEHRAMVEELLPHDPSWQSPRWDADRFALGPQG